MHLKHRVGSGLAQKYLVTIIKISHDGILGVKFCHKTMDYNIVIYVSYTVREI